MEDEEAVEPVQLMEPEGPPPGTEMIQIDQDQLVMSLRTDLEKALFDNRCLKIALTDAQRLAKELRGEIDAIALQVAANAEGAAATKTKKNTNGTGAKK